MSNWQNAKEILPPNGQEVWVKLDKESVYHGRYPNAYCDSGDWYFLNDSEISRDCLEELEVLFWREIEEI